MKKGIVQYMRNHFLSPFNGGMGWLFLLLLFCVSCDDYDSWTTNPSSQLTLSKDTVAFDTLITNQGSATKTLILFNHNDKGLRIRQVELAQGAASPFHVNVDGQYLYGGVGEDFEVRRKDSIYVRIEVKLPAMDSDDIHDYKDELYFTLESGMRQKVVLTASGMDVIILRGETITANRTLDAHRPYLVYDSLVVAPNVTLTLPEGCTLMFHDWTSLLVRGTLVANGTLEKPVIFRGDRVDRMFDNLPYDNTPNRWGGIHFFAESTNNVLTQCDIHGGDYGIVCDSIAFTETTTPLLVMENSVVHNIGGTGLSLTHCMTRFVGTQISNTRGECVRLMGGAHQFIHCTIAQFYPFSANRGDALFLTNHEGDTPYPFVWCDFLNCVVTGYADDVVMGDIVESDEEHCNFLFQNCLLRTVVSDDATRFVDVTFESPETEAKEHFVLFDTKNFLYDFAPKPESAIRGIADSEFALMFPTDRRGTNRMSDGAPDAGAYEGK